MRPGEKAAVRRIGAAMYRRAHSPRFAHSVLRVARMHQRGLSTSQIAGYLGLTDSLVESYLDIPAREVREMARQVGEVY